MKNSSHFFTNKTILITGVTGTLGGAAAERFVQEGARVKGLIRNKQQTNRLIRQGIEPVVGALEDYDRLRAALMDVDIVIHCAAYLGEDPKLAVISNVKVLTTLQEHPLKLEWITLFTSQPRPYWGNLLKVISMKITLL